VKLSAFILWASVLFAGPSWAATDQSDRSKQSEDARARAYFTDTELVTQSGRTVRFYSDMLKGKIVLVSLFYTSCEGICPVVNANLAEVQDLLADRLGKDMALISITLDPKKDTPSVIKSYADNFSTGEGWHFLTGKPEDVTSIIRKLGHLTTTPNDHTGLLVLGNVSTATWTKMAPNAPPLAIVEKLKLLAEGGLAQQ